MLQLRKTNILSQPFEARGSAVAMERVLTEGIRSKTDFTAAQLYRRLSSLTGIPLKQLRPTIKIVESDRFEKDHGACEGNYCSDDHAIELKKGTAHLRQTSEHELYHGLQKLTYENKNERSRAYQLSRKDNYLDRCVEVYARATESTKKISDYFWKTVEKFNLLLFGVVWSTFNPLINNFATSKDYGEFAIFCGITLVVIGWRYAECREKAVEKAIRKYGADGYLALNLLRCPNPFGALTILENLESKGILTGEGFTQKGEEWVRSFKSKIERFLDDVKKVQLYNRIIPLRSEFQDKQRDLIWLSGETYVMIYKNPFLNDLDSRARMLYKTNYDTHSRKELETMVSELKTANTMLAEALKTADMKNKTFGDHRATA